ncbi:MAG TPA: hypothetical protein VHF05_01120 [Candidatus Paceibacterota bacterium]|jgi:hypothetical protein|nr:hypothetical protein [Candidatus Paceibacterota bacterium]
MHTRTLRELAKFASGLIMGDILCGLGFYFGGYLPITFLGISFDAQTVVAWLIFDVLLFAFLVHYGWNTKDRSHTSREKKFLAIAGVLFTAVALAHLSRIVFGWNLTLGSWEVPYWLNGLGTIATAFLAYASFHFASRK